MRPMGRPPPKAVTQRGQPLVKPRGHAPAGGHSFVVLPAGALHQVFKVGQAGEGGQRGRSGRFRQLLTPQLELL